MNSIPENFSIICALSSNQVIGNKQQLPWHLPNDLKFFKKHTLGKNVVMGRKTFDSIGKPLPGRNIIVFSRNQNLKITGCTVINKIEQLTEICDTDAEIMIAGGSEIFKMFLPFCNKMYLTEVNTTMVGDTHFPKFDKSQWNTIEKELHLADDKHKFDYKFVSMIRAL